ncbi:MAG: thiamine phosphate synthase [Candidatus Anoxymicrobium japonicum]|uniref:Thiamine-phosphate synthase n=1 Tax=Candidatus Anoxymicrobium japonicum TaxID=2013648 RepID=A0A2N3G4Z9_9ACTN|nr:MAG: thiamine phosphate synthase [Candidatus Anoxymicrobium japonicum]
MTDQMKLLTPTNSIARRPDWMEMMRLVVITACENDLGRKHLDVAVAAVHAGCRAIQLRDKDISDRAFTETALRIQALCRESGALFFVNDRAPIAAALGCAVHLGFDDMDVARAREMLGPETIIGYSPENAPDAAAAVDSGADYMGVGPVFVTPTKSDAGEPLGVEGLSSVCDDSIAPVIAVGGINAQNAAAVAGAGARGIAVVTAVSRARDMSVAVKDLMRAFESGVKG